MIIPVYFMVHLMYKMYVVPEKKTFLHIFFHNYSFSPFLDIQTAHKSYFY